MALTDNSGAIKKSYQFDAFGNEVTQNDNDTNPFRYCGEYYDAETGFIYLWNRYYDTATGRFITEDPIKDGLNWYVYCANNPVMFTDSWGLENETDYGEFYLTGYEAEYNSLVKLGDDWENTSDKKYRDKLHAEANLIRELTRLHMSLGRATVWSPIKALNNVLENSTAIYNSSEFSGVPETMISAILYQESLYHDPLDNKYAETAIAFLRGDASFGIGQVRVATAQKAESAFFDFYNIKDSKHTKEQTQKLLQESNATNIKYVGLTLWHNGYKNGLIIDKNYDYYMVDKVFQLYNPASEGFGKRVSAYASAFYDYYGVIRK